MPKQLRFKEFDFLDRLEDTLKLAACVCCKQRRCKLLFMSFLADSPAPRVLRQSSPRLKLLTKEDYYVASLRHDEPHKLPIEFGVFESGLQTWTAFSLTETIATENVLHRFLKSLAPRFSGAYLSSADIRRIFEKLEQSSYAAEVFVNKAVAYSHRREGEISFKKQPYYAVFNRAENESMFLDKVDFTVKVTPFLHAFVTRSGIAKFLDGDIGFFRENILTEIVQTASGKHQVFRESSRKRGQVSVYPLDIDFGQAIFQDRNDNLAFLSALDLMSRSGLAVVHENPYVHVSLVDFFDGSAFDIFATAPSAVTIIPQVDASAFAMNRLCNHIFENFREGKLVKPQPRRWALEDILG